MCVCAYVHMYIHIHTLTLTLTLCLTLTLTSIHALAHHTPYIHTNHIRAHTHKHTHL